MSKIKRLLIISYWFPPANIIGAVRPAKIARFFLNQGWQVDVIAMSGLTQDHGYTENLQGINVDYIPANILQHFETSPHSSMMVRVLKMILRKCFFPDHFLLFYFAILKHSLRKYQGKPKPDIIITSALPFSTHLVGKALKSKFHCHWIADNRDLWSLNLYRKTNPLKKYFEKMFEMKVLRHADSVLAIGHVMAGEYKEKLSIKNVSVVMNGADRIPLHCDSNLSGKDFKTSDVIRFIYTGQLYRGVRNLTPIFDALVQSEYLNKFKIDFYGTESSEIEKYKKNYPQLKITEYQKVSKDKIKELQENADFLLLAIGSGPFEKGVMTGKFFEYLETGHPIICSANEDTELAILIEKYSLGIASDNPKKILTFVQRCIDTNQLSIPFPLELSRESQLTSLQKICEDLLCH